MRFMMKSPYYQSDLSARICRCCVQCGLHDKPHLLAQAAAELRLAAARFLPIYLRILNFSTSQSMRVWRPVVRAKSKVTESELGTGPDVRFLICALPTRL
jgi:hypothetical protein